MFGLSFEKLLLIGVLAVFLLGPDRLPQVAQQFARLIKSLKRLTEDAKDRMRDELGPDFDDVDWKKLDPRQYDPRRIIKEALAEEEAPAVTTPVRSAYLERKKRFEQEGKRAPFDMEAT